MKELDKVNTKKRDFKETRFMRLGSQVNGLPAMRNPVSLPSNKGFL
ncbi:MAG: hypothetical protein RLZZ338_3211 [Cyanobacteriota bacterium]|jgi:hypothetical protein